MITKWPSSKINLWKGVILKNSVPQNFPIFGMKFIFSHVRMYQLFNTIYVTRHEKTGLMYTKYTSSYYGLYLLYCSTYQSSVNCYRFAMKCYINGDNFIRLLFLLIKLFKFESKNVLKFCVHISPIFSCRVTYTDKNVILNF